MTEMVIQQTGPGGVQILNAGVGDVVIGGWHETAIVSPRGGGVRKRGGVYMESGKNFGGLPVELLLLDPPREQTPSAWLKPHRSPILFQDPDGRDTWHMCIWVGKEYYPRVWDFIEEARYVGVSRRVPSTFDFSKLSNKSRMFFVHPEAVGDFATSELQKLPCVCPPQVHIRYIGEGERCISTGNWLPEADQIMEMLAGENVMGKGKSAGKLYRKLECGAKYQVFPLPEDVDQPKRRPGVFMQSTISGVAIVQDAQGNVDKKLKKAAQLAGVPVCSVPE
jgi:hypothetical protein